MSADWYAKYSPETCIRLYGENRALRLFKKYNKQEYHKLKNKIDRRNNQRKRQEQIELNRLSNDFNKVYQNVVNIIANTENANTQFLEDFANLLNEQVNNIDQIANQEIDENKLQESVSKAQNNLIKAFNESTKKIQYQISKNNKATSEQINNILEQHQELQQDIVDWTNNEANELQQQSQLAQTTLSDASESVNLLKELASSSNNSTLIQQANIQIQALNEAKNNFNMGIYQASFVQGQNIIRQTTQLISDYMLDKVEGDFYRDLLLVSLESLKDQLTEEQTVTVIDTKSGQQKEEDLNVFSQGRLKEIRNVIDKEIKSLNDSTGEKLTAQQLQVKLNEFNNKLRPEALKILENSQNAMISYNEKLNLLKDIDEYLYQQNYDFTWAVPVGDDYTQDLVANFSRPTDGSAISVTLSNPNINDPTNIEMKLMNFYQGNPDTEDKKAELRNGLNNYLNSNNVQGSASCDMTTYNQSSKNIAYQSQDSVRKMNPKKVI